MAFYRLHTAHDYFFTVLFFSSVILFVLHSSSLVQVRLVFPEELVAADIKESALEKKLTNIILGFSKNTSKTFEYFHVLMLSL